MDWQALILSLQLAAATLAVLLVWLASPAKVAVTEAVPALVLLV